MSLSVHVAKHRLTCELQSFPAGERRPLRLQHFVAPGVDHIYCCMMCVTACMRQKIMNPGHLWGRTSTYTTCTPPLKKDEASAEFNSGTEPNNSVTGLNLPWRSDHAACVLVQAQSGHQDVTHRLYWGKKTVCRRFIGYFTANTADCLQPCRLHFRRQSFLQVNDSFKSCSAGLTLLVKDLKSLQLTQDFTHLLCTHASSHHKMNKWMLIDVHTFKLTCYWFCSKPADS